MALKNNYYVSSFFWSTLTKILNAILGFISVPLLLSFYGKSDYGILSIATACNGYMQLLDLGMNTGAVKFFSQWKADDKNNLVFRVARTNISFYLIIASFNIIGLLVLAFYGRPLFAITSDQFKQLQSCLFIIALFSAFSWVTTAFNQLLIADKQMAFTMKVQSIQVILKGALIFIVLSAKLTLSEYFFFLTSIVALAIIPYAIKCRRDNLIDSLRPAQNWNDFKIVLTFSLSIFALSLFQMTATQSRAIILSIFSDNGADTVADFRILEVIPRLIIMIGGTFSGIFLPKAAEMVAKKDQNAIQSFAYKWTSLTSILICMLCFPFILSASDVLSAYVGAEYSGLSKWLIIWCLTVLVQMHTTPGNSLVLAYGRTKLLVIVTAIACISSMLMNVLICKYIGVGSAIISYFLYVLIVIGLYYIVFYNKLLKLSRLRLFKCFIYPTLIASVLFFIIKYIPIHQDIFGNMNKRLMYILICIIRTILWIVPFTILLFTFKIVNLKMLKK